MDVLLCMRVKLKYYADHKNLGQISLEVKELSLITCDERVGVD